MPTKRKNGEGSFDKVEIKGVMYFRWRGSFGYVPETGKPKTVNLYARTEKELRQKVEARISNEKSGIVTLPKRFTVGQWVNQWFDECCKDVKPRTLVSYRSIIDNHIMPDIGGIRLQELQPHQVQTFINRLRDVSPKTIKNIHGVLHEALQKAYEWSYINRNPADGITLPRIEKQEVNYLSGKELRRFINAASGNEYENVFKLAIFTGMREGELMGLAWDAIDFKHGRITVKQQLQLIKGEYVICSTKSDKTRVIEPAPFVFDLLKEVRNNQNIMRARLGNVWTESGFVFTKYNGEHIARNTLFMNFKRTLAAAGLPASTRFHDLRHSYAVFALESGDNIKKIQAALGHYSAAFTMNTYAHVSEEARRKSAMRQEAAIFELLHAAD